MRSYSLCDIYNNCMFPLIVCDCYRIDTILSVELFNVELLLSVYQACTGIIILQVQYSLCCGSYLIKSTTVSAEKNRD